MKKIILSIFLFCFLPLNIASSNDEVNFKNWLKLFKIQAAAEGISDLTINNHLTNVKFLPKVIEYDRRQPEFYEDTITYITKRTTQSKVKKAISLYKKNKMLIDKVEMEFNVEKELLLALMGIETNFGSYLGKMDIISSLATLSFDKRRSAFFTNELVTILKLVDQNKINANILFGSWAGAVGNFQFMPTTIKNYALDYNKNSILELKKLEDSIASAANYINKIGWKKNEKCFLKINLKQDVPKKYLNTSAKKIKNYEKINILNNYIKKFDNYNLQKKQFAAIITPDKDIIDDSNYLDPAYLIFPNYELILKWNRSLRFALAVCTLKNKIKNEI